MNRGESCDSVVMLNFITTVFCNFLDCSEDDMYELSLK